MDQKLMNVLTISFLLVLAFTPVHSSDFFDVTSAKYGGKPNTDITKALLNAWTDACASPWESTIYVPKGTYGLKGAIFVGHCKAPIELQVEGTLQAPEDTGQVTSPDTWVGFRYLNRLTLSGGGTFDGRGALSWKQNDCNTNKNCKSRVVNIRFDFVNDTIIKDITSLDSKNFHFNVFACNNITFQHATITAPGDSVNTDGIHIARSTMVTVANTSIGTGDDCISIGDGTSQLKFTNVTCGPGHGISIGSLGGYRDEQPVTGVIIKNVTFNSTQNGARIKTWPASYGGLVSDIHYEDIIMVNVSNPIIIDQEYCPWNLCNKKIPSKVKISDVSFKNIKGTSTTPLAVNFICSWSVPCENVEISGIDLTYTGHKGFISSQCSNVKLATIANVTKALACGNYSPASNKNHTEAHSPEISRSENQTVSKNQTETVAGNRNEPARVDQRKYRRLLMTSSGPESDDQFLRVTSSAPNSRSTCGWLQPRAVVQLLRGFWLPLHGWL
ncbi:hypothetical protein ACLB2K_012614 [Fragaria x ananassa]